MNILFVSLCEYNSFMENDLYTDLLRCFIKNGCIVYMITPVERKNQAKTHIINEGCNFILKVKIGNYFHANSIEKGITCVQIGFDYTRAVKKHFNRIKFDIVLSATPPVTLYKVIKYIKNRDHASVYLLLKDIFPQNAVDIGLFSGNSLLYKYFRKKEENLYALSDHIGCMSQANIDYILDKNPRIDRDKIELCPNSIEVHDIYLSEEEKKSIRKKYGISEDKLLFIYGGNLGKAQGIPFLIECLQNLKENHDIFFLLVGAGTEFGKILKYIHEEKPDNVKLINAVPRDEFDLLTAGSDIGLIFLDHRFTIPNFPSRLLTYMQAGIPVLAATDKSSDIGKIITEGGFGWWCESNDVGNFAHLVKDCLSDRNNWSYKKNAARNYLKNHYAAETGYNIIIKHFL